MQSDDWTPEHSRALRECVARGLSFARAAMEINARFGTAYTRNAALGRGKRMGLVGLARREDRSTPKAGGAPKDKRDQQSAKVPLPLPLPEPDHVAAALIAPVQLRCVGISPKLISLVDLEPGDCRYPYGGDKDDDPIAFCGHPRRAGSSYCTPHFHLTREPVVPAERPVSAAPLRLVDAV